MATFADRLDRLFRTVRSPETGKPYSVRHVAAACGLSHTHLNKLRAGTAADPRWSEMEALARFFGVPIDHFVTYGPPVAPSPDEHSAALAAALRQPGVSQVALRMVERRLSPEGAAAVIRIIDEVARLEAAQRRRAPGLVADEDDTPG
jgi:transcriptional regulator with XRE-family HTH domain